MSNQIEISVILPVYNTPELYLRTCLDSLLSQTMGDFQVICVDDVSTDGSLHILEEYARKDARFQIIKNSHNQGVAGSRNRGATLATGAFLYFLDCDDWLESDAFELLIQEAKTKELDVLLFEGEFTYETEEIAENFPRPLNFLKYPPSQGEVTTGKTLFHFLQKEGRYCGFTWLLLIRRAFYQKNSFSFAENTAGGGDDFTLTLAVILKAERITYINKVLYHYQFRAGSGTTKKRYHDFLKKHLYSYLYQIKELEQEMDRGVWEESCAIYLKSTALCASHYYYEVYQADPTSAYETLLNMKHLIFDEPLERFHTWEECHKKRAVYSDFCFFGGGALCRESLAVFRAEGIPLPLAICDNNPENQGTFIDGIPVVSFQEAVEKFPKLSIMICSSKYYSQIHAQVLEKIEEDRLIRYIT